MPKNCIFHSSTSSKKKSTESHHLYKLPPGFSWSPLEATVLGLPAEASAGGQVPGTGSGIAWAKASRVLGVLLNPNLWLKNGGTDSPFHALREPWSSWLGGVQNKSGVYWCIINVCRYVQDVSEDTHVENGPQIMDTGIYLNGIQPSTQSACCSRPSLAPAQLQRRSRSPGRANTTGHAWPCRHWLQLCWCKPCQQRRVECLGTWSQLWPCTMRHHILALLEPPNGSSTEVAAPQRLPNLLLLDTLHAWWCSDHGICIHFHPYPLQVLAHTCQWRMPKLFQPHHAAIASSMATIHREHDEVHHQVGKML